MVPMVEQAMQQTATATRAAGVFATASRFDHFATASWFDRLAATCRFAHIATTASAVVPMVEQAVQQTAAAARAASAFAAASRFDRLAAASGFNHFAATCRLNITTRRSAMAKQMAKRIGVARPSQSKGTRQQGGSNKTNHRSTPDNWTVNWAPPAPFRATATPGAPFCAWGTVETVASIAA
jgi:hypothetical protein